MFKKQMRHTFKRTKQFGSKIGLPFKLTRWTIFFAVLALIFCAGVSALVIKHTRHSAVPKAAASQTAPSSQAPQTAAPTTPTQPTSPSSSAQTSTKPSTQVAPVEASTPTYSSQYLYCISGDSGKSALDDLYKQTSTWLTGEVDSVNNQVNSHSITDSQGIDQLSAYISTANGNYSSSYQTYLAGRQRESCSVDVTAPVDIPLCTYDSLSSCIDNIRNNDNAWGNLINEL
jgi:hypothetical protein